MRIACTLAALTLVGSLGCKGKDSAAPAKDTAEQSPASGSQASSRSARAHSLWAKAPEDTRFGVVFGANGLDALLGAVETTLTRFASLPLVATGLRGALAQMRFPGAADFPASWRAAIDNAQPAAVFYSDDGLAVLVHPRDKSRAKALFAGLKCNDASPMICTAGEWEAVDVGASDELATTLQAWPGHFKGYIQVWATVRAGHGPFEELYLGIEGLVGGFEARFAAREPLTPPFAPSLRTPLATRVPVDKTDGALLIDGRPMYTFYAKALEAQSSFPWSSLRGDAVAFVTREANTLELLAGVQTPEALRAALQSCGRWSQPWATFESREDTCRIEINHVGVAELELVEKTLRGSLRIEGLPAVPKSNTAPDQTQLRAFLDEPWFLGGWGRGGGWFNVPEDLRQHLTEIPPLAREALFIGLSWITEFGVGTRFVEGGSEGFVRVRTTSGYPPAVREPLDALGHADGSPATHDKLRALVSAHPKSQFAQDAESRGALVSMGALALAAGVAIPAFTKYLNKSKATEARAYTRRMLGGVQRHLVDNKGKLPASTDWVPPKGACCKTGGTCAPDPALWDTPTWKALGFRVSGAHRYSFRFANLGETFHVEATGDLDCDGVYSLFQFTGQTKALGANPRSRIENELE